MNTGQEKFRIEYARSKMVEWCRAVDTQRLGVIGNEAIVPDDPYLRVAETATKAGWLTVIFVEVDKARIRMKAGGWTAAAGFLKR